MPSVLEINPKSVSFSGEDKGLRTYTATWQVVLDGPSDDPFWVAASLNIDYGDPFVNDPYAFFRSASATPEGDENGTVWTVTGTYSNAPLDVGMSTTGAEPGEPSGDPGQGNATQTPTDRPWLVSFDSVEFTRPVTVDVVTGKGITASNGQPYDPALNSCSAGRKWVV